MATIVSVDPVDVGVLVEIVVTVRVGTGDVTLVKAKRAAHLGNSHRRSVEDLAEVVARHRLKTHIELMVIQDLHEGRRGVDGSVSTRVRGIAGGALVEGGR